MSLESLKKITSAGNLSDALPALIELQGLSFAVLTGAAANTKINLAAIRSEDTIVGAIMSAGGVLSDIKAGVTIEDLRASGTVTVASPVANDTVTINGRVYTFVAAVTDPLSNQVLIGGSDTATAANLVAKVNYVEGSGPLFAANALGVVTIKARAEGTGGNALTLASSNGTRLAVSGANLAGGTATGGIKSTTNTTGNTVLLACSKLQ